MHPIDCPEWEYNTFPNASNILQIKTKEVLVKLRKGKLKAESDGVDSRNVHHHIFNNLTPRKHKYFAGHYRGEDFKCLKCYKVQAAGDPTVGVPASLVFSNIIKFSSTITVGIQSLNEAQLLPEVRVSKIDKILLTVVFSCRIFVEFLQIHPYANGNGHMARFIIWTILGKFNLWPKSWPIDPRPPHPEYIKFITEYRKGNRTLLEDYILKCVLGMV